MFVIYVLLIIVILLMFFNVVYWCKLNLIPRVSHLPVPWRDGPVAAVFQCGTTMEIRPHSQGLSSSIQGMRRRETLGMRLMQIEFLTDVNDQQF